ncbi:lysophospholipid acyltransferase family protein [Alkaliphilus serpentinus]|nr:lysophospholipid acyltransferase family protein [Alkaliphilus serpentinus]
MRTIIWFVYFWLHLIYVSIYIPSVKRLMKKGAIDERRRLVQKIAYNWSRKLIGLTGSTIEVEGLENIPRGPVLFASNHQGNFDIPLLLANIPKPVAFVAKIELKKLPLVSSWMEYMECVFIDRKDMRQSLRTIGSAIEILKSGQSMVIFPEGTRSKSSEIQPFKPGSLKMAARAGVKIVPVTIIDSYKIMEANNNKIKPAKVKIIFSNPIETEDLDKATDLTVKTFQVIKENLQKPV